MMPKSFFPSFFLSCEEFLFFVMWNISLTPQRPLDAAQRWMVSSIFPAVGVPLLQLSPSSISACWNVLHGVCTSRDASPVSPAEPPLPPLQCYPYDLPANGIFSCTTSWQAMSGKPEPPASEINGECECCSFESTKNTEENKPTPAKREAVRERVGEAWIVWSVAQTTGSLW